jgi:hypothetical protein
MMTGSFKRFHTVLVVSSQEAGTRHGYPKDYFTASKSIKAIDHDNEVLLTVLRRDCEAIANRWESRYEHVSFSSGHIDNISGVILE